MADQKRSDSNQSRGQKPSSPQYSDEPQQTQSDKRQGMQDEEPTSTGRADRGRGSMADDRGRTDRQNMTEKRDPRDRDSDMESDLDDQDEQTDDECEDDGPAR